jgi:hypothetical protein
MLPLTAMSPVLGAVDGLAAHATNGANIHEQRAQDSRGKSRYELAPFQCDPVGVVLIASPTALMIGAAVERTASLASLQSRAGRVSQLA